MDGAAGGERVPNQPACLANLSEDGVSSRIALPEEPRKDERL
jgi:hypothetical protein